MSEEYKEKKLNEGVELPLFAYTDPKKRNDDILDDLISYIVYNLWMWLLEKFIVLYML